jgi:hypothetical protein
MNQMDKCILFSVTFCSVHVVNIIQIPVEMPFEITSILFSSIVKKIKAIMFLRMTHERLSNAIAS